MAKKPTAGPPPIPARSVESSGEIVSQSASFVTPTITGIVRPKLVIVGVEGWGKSSLISTIPNVGIIMPETETGYLTLVNARRAPAVPSIVTKTWRQTLTALEDAKSFSALALDELSGFERQCHEYVCQNNYKGDWEKFWSYHKGVRVALPEWTKFLAKLEQLGIMIVALSHCSIETFKDPVNEDHDRYVAALFRDTWGVTRRWADACLFGTFISIVEKAGDKGRAKGIGGTERILYTEHRDTHDAKNRYGMAEEIEIPADPSQIWNTIWDAINNPSKPVTVDGADADKK